MKPFINALVAAVSASAPLRALVILLPSAALFLFICCRRRSPPRANTGPSSVLAVFGSGGHTAEMISLLRALPASRFAPRSYILADTDGTSLSRATAAGISIAAPCVFIIPRAREVGGSWAGAVVGVLRGCAAAVRALRSAQPALLLVNGPGTCLPVVLAAHLMRVVGALRSDAQILFVESVCRVETLSLTGRILYVLRLADGFLVQWPALAARYPRAKCVGGTVL